MKKQAIIINYIGRKGGGALVSYEMAKVLVNAGELVIPVISDKIENRKLWEQLACRKIIFVRAYDNVVSLIFKSLAFPFLTAPKIKKELKGEKIKAVYTPMTGFWTKKVNDLFPGIKKIIVCHDPVPHSGKDKIVYCMLQHMYKDADTIITHSRKFVPYLRKNYKNVAYIPLGPHHMYQDLQEKRNVMTYDDTKINFLFFGRIDEYKGIDILLHAYKIVERKHSGQVTLTIAGNGDISKYKKKIKELKNITVINRWINDNEVESLFSGRNLVTVCPYKDATQSGVILVSYNYEIPVIATDIGGLKEQIINGKTGFLIKRNCADALADAMEKFIELPQTIENMRTHISDYLSVYMSKISWNRSAQILLDIINK